MDLAVFGFDVTFEGSKVLMDCFLLHLSFFQMNHLYNLYHRLYFTHEITRCTAHPGMMVACCQTHCPK